MAIKLKLPPAKTVATAGRRSSPRPASHFSFSDPVVRIAATFFLVAVVIVLGVFIRYYVQYQHIIDRRLHGQIFANATKVYARPAAVWVGESISAEEIAAQLRRAGYMEADKSNGVGSYRLLARGIEIHPGPESYHNQDGALVREAGGKVERIVGTGSSEGRELSAYELEPTLITAVDTDQRTKRQLVDYKDIPKVLVDAVTSIEDRRFFQHSGVNYWRFLQAGWIDLRQGGARRQGGSTITMQVSRMFFLSPEKTIKRKATEMLIAVELEQKLSKEQIFSLYANQVDLGQRGSYTITGFAEASRSYFNKDLQSISLPEAALLAGLIQRPSYLSPYRHPERALERRNLVLEAMVDTGAIKRDQADKAKATPLKLAPPNVEASDAPYFVDLVKDSLLSRYNEHDLAENSYRIYTTLDPDLQKAAAEAVQEGIKKVDAQVEKLRTRRIKVGKGKNAKTEVKTAPGPMPQVALVAVDPHSGEVLALVGGRNYGLSQLNHAVARRPTGSVFKPFVYAAAVNTALNGDASNAITPASLIDDSPGTYTYGDQIYEPRNYKDEYHGVVSARFALAQSLNNATVKLAEQVGYDKVAALARAAGIKSVQPTPAMALGAYDATPLDIAGAYTVFANGGVRISPTLASSVRDAHGQLVENFQSDRTLVLDPRVAYVMTTMMEGVINNGTAAGVRAMGFSAPAAGKTGTSHDGWFAGYTSNLLCIVWVGFDDYSDLRLSGSSTAAPIWAEFMKRAVKLPSYKDAQPFQPPAGVVAVRLDKATNRLATAACPDDYTVAFIAGTEPKDSCDQPMGEHRGIFSRIFGANPAPTPPVIGSTSNTVRPSTPAPVVSSAPTPQDSQDKKKGIFGKIVGIFKGDEKPSSPPAKKDGGNNPH
ncbi:MAG TPA: PBP1A family penicillin-binding protein [Terriglobales bacterium]|nr:PBP1A family penicillin-binding protein [Terriglobales bacterium]